jgi:arylsulfatase A-like enzyme
MVAAACALAGASAGGPAVAAAPAQPNVVLIVTDDQAVADLYERTRAGKKGKPLMPRTLSLIAGRGVTFSRAYASNPLSCPSRASLLTGQHSYNHRIYGNRWPGGGFCSDAGRIDLTRSLPVWLQNAGYRTLHYGRFLNGWGTQDPDRVPPGWNEYVAPVDTKESPAALYFGYHLNEDGVVGPQYGPVRGRDPGDYFTDVIGSKANTELQTSNLTQPFFLSIDHRAPHEDLADPIGPEPAPRHAGTMQKKLPRRPPSFNEANVRDKAPYLRLSRRLTRGQIDAIRRRNVRRLRSLRAVDDWVGYLFETLEAFGELDETYVIFMSDHGFLNGEHRLPKGKRRPYEPATRIPILIRGPGIPAGQTSSELVSNVDVVPTILELTGASANRTQDGRSLLPFAKSPDARTARPILLESYYGRFIYDPEATVHDPRTKAPPAPTPKTWKGIVIGRWKLVRYSKHVMELYDLRRDPFELRSLARRARFEPVVKKLFKQLRRLAKCSGASCRYEVKVPSVPRRAGRRSGGGA